VHEKVPSRREFVKTSIAAALAGRAVPARGARAADARGSEPARHAVRLGAPVSGGGADPEAVALAHRALGYRAAYCPEVAITDTPRIRAIADAFRKHDVVIAEVGRWVNLLDPDAAKRQQNLKTVTEGLALADEVGALCTVDIAGSYSATEWFGPSPGNLSKRFFDEAVANARTIIDAVKPRRAKFCYEAMGWSYPDGPDSYVDMIRAIDRPAFGAHLDPCNMVNCPSRFWNSSELIGECFDKLGKWIVSCHAKDLRWVTEMNVHFVEVRPGTGTIDYSVFLDRLARLPQDAPLMLEHLPNAEEYDKARLHIFEVGKKSGIEF
jgi:sugar phosphate isomerase/epimerase